MAYETSRDLMVKAMLGMAKRARTRDAQDAHYALGYLSGAVAAWVAQMGDNASEEFLKYVDAQAQRIDD